MSKPKDRPRLGRGLSSLISSDYGSDEENDPVDAANVVEGMSADSANSLTTPSATANSSDILSLTSDKPTTTVRDLPLDSIHPNPHQPRRQFNDASLAELAASLKFNGIIQPIIVRQVGQTFELIAGERRWRAAKLANLKDIPAIVRIVDTYTQAQMALVENIQRENLNPMDRARAYQVLMTQLGTTQAELSVRLGEDRSAIANHLRLLELCDAVRQYVAVGQLSLGHAKLLASLPDIKLQEEFAKRVVSQELSVRNLEKMIALELSMPGKTSPTPSVGQSAHVRDLEKSISRELGMRVQLAAKSKGKGRLVIHYASLDQFDDLLKKLKVRIEE